MARTQIEKAACFVQAQLVEEYPELWGCVVSLTKTGESLRVEVEASGVELDLSQRWTACELASLAHSMYKF